MSSSWNNSGIVPLFWDGADDVEVGKDLVAILKQCCPLERFQPEVTLFKVGDQIGSTTESYRADLKQWHQAVHDST